MAGWTDDLASLFLLRDSLEGTVSTNDITVLQERLQLLQCQWGEVCHQVASNFPLTVPQKFNDLYSMLMPVSYLSIFFRFPPISYPCAGNR